MFIDQFTYLHLTEIQDEADQSLKEYLPIGLKFIADALSENETNKVLVHCAAGVSRSGAFCIAYMLTKEPSWSVEDTIKYA
jgi:dual specificity phosphatase 12